MCMYVYLFVYVCVCVCVCVHPRFESLLSVNMYG